MSKENGTVPIHFLYGNQGLDRVNTVGDIRMQPVPLRISEFPIL